MKLKEACEIAKDCGLETVEEAVDNINIHSISLFSYDELSSELNELNREYKEYLSINHFLNSDS